MASHPLYGKRKKKIPRCPNPLFASWLAEWREDAANKNMKTQYVYGKALKSLQKYPLLLKSGKDCKMLEHFGDKTCKMLDDKLSEYISIHGADALMPTIEISDDDDDDLPQKKLSKPKSNPKPAATAQNCVPPQRVCHALSDSGSSEDESVSNPPPKKRQRSGRKSGDKEYIPAYRSGPYAVLLTLYKNMQSADSRGYMTKAELIREAQSLADKSFTVPDPGCRYTAWSSMGTLIKKGFVVKEGSPAKYSLTDAGCELAHKLEFVQANPVNDNSAGNTSSRVPPAHDVYNISQPTSLFEFCYISTDNTEVRNKDDAAVLIDDDLGIGFLIKCNYQKLLGSGKTYRLDTSRPLGDDVYAYLHNNDAPDFSHVDDAPPLPSLDSNIAETVTTDTKKEPKKKKTDSTIAQKASKSTTKQYASLTSANVGSKLLPLIDNLPPPPPSALQEVTTASSNLTDSQDSQHSIKSISSASSAKSLPDPDFIFMPGMFEIVLCIDNQEFYGASKGGSKTLLPDLMKNGVNCDLRKLQVGDILWVAKEKTHSVPGQLTKPQARELVLDYIIERKRMDDLVHSCTDGRLPDQKFRLKHCGLRHPIFLVEDYGSMQHFSMPEERVRQTITNLKVIDGFEVKRTKDSKETVAYLTVMTRYLQSYFRNKTLYACKRDDLLEVGPCDINDVEQRLMTFPEFNQGSIKSKALTVQEIFGKQLIQIHGMSAEKAKAITEKYPTISHLYSAYEKCTSEKEKEVMINGIKCGKSMRMA